MTAIEAVNPTANADAAAAGADNADSVQPSPHSVLSGREQIDSLDSQIAGLVLRRIEVSKQIQAARIAEGGRRVDVRRENDIIARYNGTLGRPGTAIAMALLELCRGRA